MTCRQCNNLYGCFTVIGCVGMSSGKEEEKVETEIVLLLSLAEMCHLTPMKSMCLFQHGKKREN